MAPSLSELLQNSGGRMPVQQFVEQALYHPNFGYYSRSIHSVGRDGDFSTAATLSPVLGRGLAQWLIREKNAVPERSMPDGRWHVIECGGGDGSLAESVLERMGWWAQRKLTYHIVDISAPLLELQARRLRKFKNVRWHKNISDALAECRGNAIVFGNEFVDAFPPTVVQWDEESAEWLEVYLEARSGDRIAEVLVPTTDALASIVREPAGWPRLTDGQRCEVALSYRNWLDALVTSSQSISLLMIDYGDTFPEVYYRRPNGTLRAYFEQQRIEGPEVYNRLGQQDLTFDVNFTDLEQWGRSLGFEALRLEDQAAFLSRESGPSSSTDKAARYLLNEEGPGSAFKVLHQRFAQSSTADTR